MNKFVFLAAMAVSATMLVSCDDDEQVVPPTLSVDLDGAVLNVGAEGGSSVVSCTIDNPAADGELSATTEADWITLTCTDNAEIVVEAKANASIESREAVVAVKYTYGDAELNAEFTVAQAGAEITADYMFTEPYVAGQVASMMGMTYFALYVSEQEIPEDFELPYNPEYVYYSIGLFDVEDGKPKAGTYSLGSGAGYFNAAAYGTAEAPYYNPMTEGTLTISYEGETVTLLISMTDGYEKTHYISYTGTPRFE